MMLELKNISKTYVQGKLEVPALRNIFLSVGSGEFLAIMGPSGSGKTTLMNIIGCLDRPTEGSYILDGNDIAASSESKMSDIRLHSIGFVFQSFHLLPRQSALENVALPLLYAGVKRKARLSTAKKLLEYVGLGDRINFKPTQLSGGERQRVAIARALVNGPKVLLADEPTGSLDSKSGQQIMELFRKLNREGVTVIIITHAPEIAEYADRVINIMDGMIIGSDPEPMYDTQTETDSYDETLSEEIASEETEPVSPYENENFEAEPEEAQAEVPVFSEPSVSAEIPTAETSAPAEVSAPAEASAPAETSEPPAPAEAPVPFTKIQAPASQQVLPKKVSRKPKKPPHAPVSIDLGVAFTKIAPPAPDSEAEPASAPDREVLPVDVEPIVKPVAEPPSVVDDTSKPVENISAPPISVDLGSPFAKAESEPIDFDILAEPPAKKAPDAETESAPAPDREVLPVDVEPIVKPVAEPPSVVEDTSKPVENISSPPISVDLGSPFAKAESEPIDFDILSEPPAKKALDAEAESAPTPDREVLPVDVEPIVKPAAESPSVVEDTSKPVENISAPPISVDLGSPFAKAESKSADSDVRSEPPAVQRTVLPVSDVAIPLRADRASETESEYTYSEISEELPDTLESGQLAFDVFEDDTSGAYDSGNDNTNGAEEVENESQGSFSAPVSTQIDGSPFSKAPPEEKPVYDGDFGAPISIDVLSESESAFKKQSDQSGRFRSPIKVECEAPFNDSAENKEGNQ